MIDELAKAIANSDGAPWKHLGDTARENYRDQARAVLTRLMEPTPGMIDAGCDTLYMDCNIEVGSLTAAYQAMLRAAMEE